VVTEGRVRGAVFRIQNVLVKTQSDGSHAFAYITNVRVVRLAEITSDTVHHAGRGASALHP